MTKKSRTPRTAAFKKKLALEALREDKTLGQLAGEHGVHPLQIGKWKKIRTVNVVKRLNQEIKRRTRVARLFPNEASCERLIGAIAMNLNEDWATENKRYISFN